VSGSLPLSCLRSACSWPPANVVRLTSRRPLAPRSESDPPALDRSQHNEGLCDFVTAALAQDPAARPTAEALTKHSALEGRDEAADASELRGWIHACIEHDHAVAAAEEVPPPA
jgi:serine/threonine protein kinase